MKKFLSLSIFCLIQALHAFAEPDLNSLDIFVMLLEKNIMRVERYALHELHDGDNVMTRKISNAHCSHLLHLGERGLHVDSIKLNQEKINELKVLTLRGKKSIEFALEWTKLLLADQAQANAAMIALVQVESAQAANAVIAQGIQAQDMAVVPAQELAAVPTEDHVQPAQEQADGAVVQEFQENRARSQSTIVVSYEPIQRTMNLIYDRQVESAVVMIVPRELSKEEQADIQILKKSELMQAGLLTRVDAEVGEPVENVVQENVQEQNAANSDELIYRNTDAPKNTEKQTAHTDDKKECEQCSASSWYNTVCAKVAALKDYVLELCGY